MITRKEELKVRLMSHIWRFIIIIYIFTCRAKTVKTALAFSCLDICNFALWAMLCKSHPGCVRGKRTVYWPCQRANTAAQFILFAARGDKSMSITGSEATECSLKMPSKTRPEPLTAVIFAQTLYRLTGALVVFLVILSSLRKFMSALVEGYIGHKSSLSFCIFSTVSVTPPPPPLPPSPTIPLFDYYLE